MTSPPGSVPAPAGSAGWIAWFRDLGVGDAAVAGGKGANLGELDRAGFPVPPGFVVTAASYVHAIDAGGVRGRLPSSCRARATPMTSRSRACRVKRGCWSRKPGCRMISAKPWSTRTSGSATACRSRCGRRRTAEDSASTSFAGMNETFTNVRRRRGPHRPRRRLLGVALRRARVSRTVSRAGLTDEPAIAVVVQRMVDSDRAGVVFSADPRTGDRTRIVIEARSRSRRGRRRRAGGARHLRRGQGRTSSPGGAGRRTRRS